VVNKSYSNFWRDLAALGFEIKEVEGDPSV
jgi:hypothetical protein